MSRMEGPPRLGKIQGLSLLLYALIKNAKYAEKNTMKLLEFLCLPLHPWFVFPPTNLFHSLFSLFTPAQRSASVGLFVLVTTGWKK